MLSPASPQGSQIAGLFWGVFAVAAVIFIGVETVLIYSIIRFRQRPDSPQPPQIHGHWTLETAWTLAPALILAGVFVATASTMVAVTERQQSPLRVLVTGHQWFWQIEYPDLNIVTATDLHVPADYPVEIEVVSADVIHSFWAPQLAGKIDVIPGHSNFLRFTPNQPGVYRGQCAEFCGAQHANMGFEVVVDSSETFDNWVKEMQTVPEVPTTGPAARGAQVFVSTSPCFTCHTIQGTRAQAKIGPDLTHFASRRTIAALTLENTPENLATWLEDPQAVKPHNKMVIPPLRQDAIQDLVAYLETLK